MPNPFNAETGAVYISDNFHFLRAINSESVDLVCIDPPFSKNETFGRKNPKDQDPLKPPLTQKERDDEMAMLAGWGIHNRGDAKKADIDWPETAYKDFWSWGNDIHESWNDDLKQSHPHIAALIEVTRYTHSESTAAYLCYMAIRLLEIHRILKPTGSLYLHCDHTANGYLRQLLDAIFGNGEQGQPGFANEIVWRRTHSKNAVSSRFGTNHDTIFFYSKSNQPRFYKDNAYRPFDDEQPALKGYRKDKNGRLYALSPVYGPNESSRDSGKPATFRGVTYTPPVATHWRVPGGRLKGETTSEGWARLDKQGRMHLAKNGKLPQYIRYLDEMKGIAIDDVWVDIKIPSTNERTGYPTQKPVALAERIIKASTKPDDVVLDCFAGCAYVAIAAQRLERRWVACDIQPRAWTVFNRQFRKPQLSLFIPKVFGPYQLPQRDTSLDREDYREVRNFQPRERKYKEPALFTREEMLELLLSWSGYRAWCCGFANFGPDLEIIETIDNFELDHIKPKSRHNANAVHHIQNRAPLCPAHNRLKGNRPIDLQQLRQEIADAGQMRVKTINDLIDLDWAWDKAQEAYAARVIQRDRERNPMGLPV